MSGLAVGIFQPLIEGRHVKAGNIQRFGLLHDHHLDVIDHHLARDAGHSLIDTGNDLIGNTVSKEPNQADHDRAKIGSISAKPLFKRQLKAVDNILREKGSHQRHHAVEERHEHHNKEQPGCGFPNQLKHIQHAPEEAAEQLPKKAGHIPQ